MDPRYVTDREQESIDRMEDDQTQLEKHDELRKEAKKVFSYLPPWVAWIAMEDRDGVDWFFFEVKPFYDNGVWSGAGKHRIPGFYTPYWKGDPKLSRICKTEVI